MSVHSSLAYLVQPLSVQSGAVGGDLILGVDIVLLTKTDFSIDLILFEKH